MVAGLVSNQKDARAVVTLPLIAQMQGGGSVVWKTKKLVLRARLLCFVPGVFHGCSEPKSLTFTSNKEAGCEYRRWWANARFMRQLAE